MPHDRQTKPEIPDEPPSPVAAAGQTTLLLRRLGEGDSEAGDALFELVATSSHEKTRLGRTSCIAWRTT